MHAFAPGTLAWMLREAGFAGVRVRGEELLANVYGWAARAIPSDPATGSDQSHPNGHPFRADRTTCPQWTGRRSPSDFLFGP